MPKKFIRRYLPSHITIRESKYLRIFGSLLHEPNLWHLNRRSASGAFGIGLFFAFWPVPFQMFFSTAAAIIFRVNLPLSLATVWLTNPLTMPPYILRCLSSGEYCTWDWSWPLCFWIELVLVNRKRFNDRPSLQFRRWNMFGIFWPVGLL